MGACIDRPARTDKIKKNGGGIVRVGLVHQTSGHGVEFRKIDFIPIRRIILTLRVVIRVELLRPERLRKLRHIESRLVAGIQAPELGGGRCQGSEQKLIRGVEAVQIVILQHGECRFMVCALAEVSFIKLAKDSIRNL